MIMPSVAVLPEPVTADCPNFRGGHGTITLTSVSAAKMGLSPFGRSGDRSVFTYAIYFAVGTACNPAAAHESPSRPAARPIPPRGNISSREL